MNTTATPTATAYLRVSTSAQDNDNQRAEIIRWCQVHGLTIRNWHTEQASTKTAWRDRLLAQIIGATTAGETLVVAEVSRLARSTLEVLEILKECAARGVSVHVVKSSLILDGSMQAKITVTVLALAAEIERDLIRARTRAALATRRAAGLPLGRPRGHSDRTKIDDKSEQIDYYLAARASKATIARLLGVSRGTLYRYLEARKRASH